MPIALIIVLIVAASGGVSFAAEKALPGEVLFPVKVLVNEKVIGTFTFSPEAKAELEAKLAGRRLGEAEALAKRQTLKADVRVRIEENFKAHADRVRARVDELEARGKVRAAAELSSNFEVSLRAHERILEHLATTTATTTPGVTIEIEKLVIKVKRERDKARQDRAEAEAKVSAQTGTEAESAAEGRMESAENKIEEVGEFIEKWESRLGAEAAADAQARLKVAEETFAQGKARLEAKAFGEAFALFSQAHRIAQEAKLLVEARKNLDLKVKFEGAGTTTEAEDEDELSGEAKIKIRITPRIRIAP